MFFAATIAACGTSIIFPTYSTPILADGLLIATSPDDMRLIGLTPEGKQKWVRRLSARGSVYKHSSGKAMLITGSSVGLVNSGNGDSTPLFEAKAGLANLRYLDSADLFFGTKESAGISTIVVYDGGKLRRQAAAKPADSIGPSGLRSEKGMLMYVASELNTRDFNRSKQTVYRVSVPDLKTVETKVVEVIEAARVETAGEYLISDALYRTACFRRDGSKVWEHFQMHRTGVIDGVIYFSDYEKGVARIGSLKVSSGKKRILISERVELK
jgi:hypothetical protein